MGREQWIVVLVRAWCEGDQFRARLISSDVEGQRGVFFASSPQEAALQVRDQLDRLGDDAGTDPSERSP